MAHPPDYVVTLIIPHKGEHRAALNTVDKFFKMLGIDYEVELLPCELAPDGGVRHGTTLHSFIMVAPQDHDKLKGVVNAKLLRIGIQPRWGRDRQLDL